MLKGFLILFAGALMCGAFLNWLDQQPDVRKEPARVHTSLGYHDQFDEIIERAQRDSLRDHDFRIHRTDTR